MKTLIIEGSNYRTGNSIELLKELKRYLKSDVIETSAYYDPNFLKKLEKAYDCDYIVISSPISRGNITKHLLFLNNYLEDNNKFKDNNIKNGILLLSGYNMVCPYKSIEFSKSIFEKFNSNLENENIVLSLNSEIIPAKYDINAKEKIKEITLRINR